MENFWRNSRSGSKFAVWRYIGTKEGVFRKFPGSRMVLEYDATKRPWYQQAVADFNRTSFYGPYVDASQTGCYISIAKAVTGNTCFVIDRSGFLLIHSSFYPTSPTCNGISNVHITCSSESYIAWSLIQNKILINDYCISYVGMNKLKFWKIQLPGETTSFNGTTLSSSYTIYAVPQTNIFVIVKYGQSIESKQYCSCSQQFQHPPSVHPSSGQSQLRQSHDRGVPNIHPSLQLFHGCLRASSSSSVLGPAIGVPVGIVVAEAIIIVAVLIVRSCRNSGNNNGGTPAKETSSDPPNPPNPPYVTKITVLDPPTNAAVNGETMQSMGVYDVTGPSSDYQALRESNT